MSKRGFDSALSRGSSRCLFADSLLPLAEDLNGVGILCVYILYNFYFST